MRSFQFAGSPASPYRYTTSRSCTTAEGASVETLALHVLALAGEGAPMGVSAEGTCPRAPVEGSTPAEGRLALRELPTRPVTEREQEHVTRARALATNAQSRAWLRDRVEPGRPGARRRRAARARAIAAIRAMPWWERPGACRALPWQDQTEVTNALGLTWRRKTQAPR